MHKISVVDLTETILRTSTGFEQSGLPMQNSAIYKAGIAMKEEIVKFGDELFEQAKARSSKAALKTKASDKVASDQAASGEAAPGEAAFGEADA